MHTYIRKYIHTHIYTCIHKYMHTYIHACTHTYLHTYILTHIHTYIHRYIYIHGGQVEITSTYEKTNHNEYYRLRLVTLV